MEKSIKYKWWQKGFQAAISYYGSKIIEYERDGKKYFKLVEPQYLDKGDNDE